MSNVNINYEGVQNNINMLEQQISILNDLLNKQDGNFSLLKYPSIYYGPANEDCISKYNELSKKYDDIVRGVVSYKNFLIGIVNSYKAYDDALNKSANSLNN